MKYKLTKIKLGTTTMYDLNTPSVGIIFRTKKEAENYLKRFGYLKRNKKNATK